MYLCKLSLMLVYKYNSKKLNSTWVKSFLWCIINALYFPPGSHASRLVAGCRETSTEETNCQAKQIPEHRAVTAQLNQSSITGFSQTPAPSTSSKPPKQDSGP